MHDLPSAADLESIAIDVARDAAALVVAGFGHARTLGTKSSPTDIVTDIDVASERLMRGRLQAATPDCGILGEEQGAIGSRHRLQWIVDPLDGTVNFAYGVPLFSVSIGAAVDGEMVAGAVVDAVRGDVFAASLDGGARLNGETMRVTVCANLSEALITTGFSYQPGIRAEQGDIVRALLPAARDVRCFGSAALQLCWVAAGWVDGYFERDTKLWDHAAGSIIAREAGALIELPCPENDGLMIAAPRSIFEQLRVMVEPASSQAPDTRSA